MKLSRNSIHILKMLIYNYIQNNSLEYDPIALNSNNINRFSKLNRDVHHVSMAIRQLVSNNLVEAKFESTNDECIYIKLTDSGKSYFLNRRNDRIKSIIFPIAASIATSIITTLAFPFIKNLFNKLF